MDWMDEVLDGKPEEADFWKIGYIENLLHRTAIPNSEQNEIMNSLDILNNEDADKIIKYIKENEIHSDPKHQYEAMRKNGMFDDRYI
jgi:tetrahydromethanopterin S-methyltransferase subunit A